MTGSGAPGGAEGAFWQAASAGLAARDAAGVAALCARMLDRHPGHVGALCFAGMAARMAGNAGAAADFLRRAVVIDPAHAGAHCELGKAFHLLGRHADALAALERAGALAPAYADAAYNRALALAALGRDDDALAAYAEALAVRPDHVDALNNRGTLLARRGRHAEARETLDAALACAPGHARVLGNRGLAAYLGGRSKEALDYLERALAVDPDDLDTLVNRASVLLALGRREAARASLTAAAGRQPASDWLRWHLGLIELLLGDFASGWRGQEARFGSVLAGHVPVTGAPRWRGEDIAGRVVLLAAEQGFGDIVQFCRYAPLVAARGARVILSLPADLAPLAAELDGVAQVHLTGAPAPAADFECPLMSLPHLFGTTLGSIPAAVPYLRAPAARVPRWRAALGTLRAPRVGLAWSGNPGNLRDRERSIPAQAFLPLLDLPAGFVSLQKTVRESDRAAVAAMRDVFAPGAALADFADTAALIGELDLVISVDTAVAHLAGALAKPVWLIVSHVPEWRWLLDRDDSPWYPTLRVFRQPAPGTDWGPTIAMVAAALRQRLAPA